jgi:hypothetical protein
MKEQSSEIGSRNHISRSKAELKYYKSKALGYGLDD